MQTTNLTKSKRSYTDILTNEKYDLYVNDATKHFHLINSAGIELKSSYYLCAFDSVTIKLNTKKQISLSMNDMYVMQPGEKLISRKFAGFNKFYKA